MRAVPTTDQVSAGRAERLRLVETGSPEREKSRGSRTSSPRVERWLTHVALGSLTVFLMLWLWIVEQFVVSGGGPNGVTMGVDFSHTYSAILALGQGLNPYDYHVLSHVQHTVLVPLHLAVEPSSPIVLVGTSPFFLWILRPITWLPYQEAALLWIASSYVLSGAALLVVLRFFGWKRRILPTVVFMAAPQTVLAAYYGNTIDLVFIGMACAVPLLNRRPLLAGVLLSLATLKAPAMIPLALLLILFHASAKKRALIGLIGAFVARNMWAAILVGHGSVIDRWTDGLFTFSQSMERQPNLIGLSGLYVGKLAHGERMLAELLAVGVASAITFAWYWRWRHEPSIPFLASAWLWPLWLLATPYAHFIDEMVLVIPLVAVLGVDGERIGRPLSVLLVAVLNGSILLYSTTIGSASMLWLPLMAVMLCFFRAARSAGAWSSPATSIEAAQRPGLNRALREWAPDTAAVP